MTTAKLILKRWHEMTDAKRAEALQTICEGICDDDWIEPTLPKDASSPQAQRFAQRCRDTRETLEWLDSWNRSAV